MTRMQPLAREALPDLEALLAPAQAVLGFIPNSLLTLARRPEILRAFAGLSRAVFAPGGISPELKMLAAYISSTAAGCRYCQAHSLKSAVLVGVPAEKVASAWEFESHPGFSEAERAALRFARDAALLPNAVTDAHFAALRRHFSDDQIVELMAVIATMGWLNRWNDTMATSLEPEPRALAASVLAPRGWEPGKHGAC